MSPTRKAEDFVEIFVTDSTMTAQKIIDVLLAPEGIEVRLHDRKDQAFPSVGQPGGVFIAVPEGQRDKAVGLLDEARENGYLNEEDGAKV